MLLLHRVLVPNCEKTVDTPAATPAEQTLGAALEQSCSHPLPVIRHIGLSSAVLPPVKDEWEHWSQVKHPSLDPRLQPALEIIYDRLTKFSGDVCAFRSLVLRGVRELIDSRRQETESWFQSLQPHVQAAYERAAHADSGCH